MGKRYFRFRLLHALHHVVKCAVKETFGGVGIMNKELVEKIRTKKAHTKVLGFGMLVCLLRQFLRMQVYSVARAT